jgi:HEAT repeat protein
MNISHKFTCNVVCLAALVFAVVGSVSAQDNSSKSTEKEKELIAVLRSDATAAEKAISCKQLAIHGSSAAVAELAKLLPDEQLSSWSRIAIEAIPGIESDDALRNATKSLEGRLLIGMINSIGVRRDAKSVQLLTTRLQDKDTEVASAAAVALGRIGNDAAKRSLREALAVAPDKVRSAVAEGCVLVAERLHANGKSAEAVALYDEIRKADVPKQRIIEATRGAILARNEKGIPLLMEQFRSPDKKMFQLALGTVREFPGSQVDKALSAELDKATSARAALIIQAMADRADTVDLSVVLKAAQAGPDAVRMSAIDALARVGDESCLASLLAIAIGENMDLAKAARSTLVSIPGEKVDAQFASLLPSANEKSYPLLIEIVGQRQIEATDELITALKNSDKNVRTAALGALGKTVNLKNLSLLISQVIEPKHPEDSAAALQALKVASIRMSDREACATKLANALNRLPAAFKSNLLELLSEVGGDKALATIGKAAKSKDPRLQDTASRLLGKWNSVDAAPVMLDLAKTASEDKFKIRALRGYIGIARKFSMTNQQRAEMCRSALNAARRPNEQKLVLDVLKLHPSTDGLKLAIKTMDNSKLKDEATQATLFIAQKLGRQRGNIAKLLETAGFEKIKLEIVKAQYGFGATQKDVTAVLQKQAGDLPLITLPAAGYNASFGGDPFPGSVKQLKIQYRINGKAGNAVFEEDAIIILPAGR